METGKLYRITSYAYENTIDVQNMANRDGWLWVVEQNQNHGVENRFYRFRSVATGNTVGFLFSELEAADE